MPRSLRGHWRAKSLDQCWSAVLVGNGIQVIGGIKGLDMLADGGEGPDHCIVILWVRGVDQAPLACRAMVKVSVTSPAFIVVQQLPGDDVAREVIDAPWTGKTSPS